MNFVSDVSAEEIAGNFHNKYESRNIISRVMMQGFWRAFDELVTRTQASTVFECGCGEGYLSLRLLEQKYDVRGCDRDQGIIDLANERAEERGYGRRFFVRDFMNTPPDEEAKRADLLICCQVFEHLSDPTKALELIEAQARDWVLLSVPREPIWRMLNLARFAYVSRLGNTPGHVQHWSTRSFIEFVSTRLEIIEQRTPTPWTFLLCRKRGSKAL